MTVFEDFLDAQIRNSCTRLLIVLRKLGVRVDLTMVPKASSYLRRHVCKKDNNQKQQ